MPSGPSNQINWGELLSSYDQTQKNDYNDVLARQAAEQAAARNYINNAMAGIEDQVYANVDQGVSGDITKADGYSALVDQYNQHLNQQNHQMAQSAWENVFSNPFAVKDEDKTADPWTKVMDNIQSTQKNADTQAQKAWQQKINAQNSAWKPTWEDWASANPDDPNMGAGYNTGQLSAARAKSQSDWKASHNGSLEGWDQSLAGAYYNHLMTTGNAPKAPGSSGTVGWTANDSGYGGFAGTVYPDEEEDTSSSSNNPNSANSGTGGF